MYETAQLMSISPRGEVTLPELSSLPLILALFGEKAEDMNIECLSYCWRAGLSSRKFVDRLGFGKVWTLVQGKFV